MARGAIREGEAIAAGSGSVEVTMWAAITLVIVSGVQAVFAVESDINLAESCVLIKAASEASRGGVHLSRKRRVLAEKTRREIGGGGRIVDRNWLVADLAS